MPQKIVVLGTGGTIAGVSHKGGGYAAGALGLAALLPEEQGLECVDVCRIDSKDMAWPHWQALCSAVKQALAREDVAAVLITHGTDTMEETAWCLQLLHGHSSKPIVLTGAMRPADHASPDGPGNLLDALTVARDAQARWRGVMVVMAGGIHSARAVRKVHGWALSAFSSGADALLGHVQGACVSWHSSTPVSAAVVLASGGLGGEALTWPEVDSGQLNGRQQHHLQQAWDTGPWPWVEAIGSGALADPRAVEAWVVAGLEGLVVAGTGSGTVHREWLQVLERHANALPLVLCSGLELANMPPVVSPHWLGSSTLTPKKARIALALWLMQVKGCNRAG